MIHRPSTCPHLRPAPPSLPAGFTRDFVVDSLRARQQNKVGCRGMGWPPGPGYGEHNSMHATVCVHLHPVKYGGRLVPSGLNSQLAPSTHAHGVFFLSFFHPVKCLPLPPLPLPRCCGGSLNYAFPSSRRHCAGVSGVLPHGRQPAAHAFQCLLERGDDRGNRPWAGGLPLRFAQLLLRLSPPLPPLAGVR